MCSTGYLNNGVYNCLFFFPLRALFGHDTPKAFHINIKMSRGELIFGIFYPPVLKYYRNY